MKAYPLREDGGEASRKAYPLREDEASKGRRRLGFVGMGLVVLLLAGGAATARVRQQEDAGVDFLRREGRGGMELPAKSAFTGPHRMVPLAGEGKGGSEGGGEGAAVVAGKKAAVPTNMRMASQLEQEWALLHSQGAAKLKGAEQRLARARHSEKDAEGEIKEAAKMKLKAKALLDKGRREQEAFRQEEAPVVSDEKQVEASSKAYREDVLHLAALIPQIAALKAAGRAVPSKLSSEAHALDAKLQLDSATRARVTEQLSQASRSTSVDYNRREGQSPENLRVQSRGYELEDAADTLTHKAYEQIAADMRARSRAHASEGAAKRLLHKAACVKVRQQHWEFNEDEMPKGQVAGRYAAILAACEV